MSTDTTIAGTIDAAALRALRASDEYVIFHAEWNGGELTESRIVGKRRDAVGDSYVAVSFDCPSRMEFGGSIVREHATVRAYASVSSPRMADEWRTFVALLRAGDEITLQWSADGWRNQYASRAGLHVDHLTARIVRGKRTLTFQLAHSVCPANTARMFTGAGSSPIDGPPPIH